MRWSVAAAWFAGVAAGLAGCGAGGDTARLDRTAHPAARGAIQSRVVQPEPVPVERVESGEVELSKIEDARLEAMLRDLNRRRDYDASQHGGAGGGPDGAYLTAWRDRVMEELLRRDYYVDEAGQLRRPGAVVPVR